MSDKMRLVVSSGLKEARKRRDAFYEDLDAALCAVIVGRETCPVAFRARLSGIAERNGRELKEVIETILPRLAAHRAVLNVYHPSQVIGAAHRIGKMLGLKVPSLLA